MAPADDDDDFIMTLSDGEEESEEASEPSEDTSAAPVAHPYDEGSEASEGESVTLDAEEQARLDTFFAPTEDLNHPSSQPTSFLKMNLSRRLLLGLNSLGFSRPTPIQLKTIPIALLGKDIVGGAVTGSGKTAAFLIPILERLLFRSRRFATSRVAILMPTRELAMQCNDVAQKLAKFTDISFCLLVGGFSIREQENALRKRPDVIIATPGRFIDHMLNSSSFTLDTLEILVLDEADRMLEDGFKDELNQILATIPRSRQTMLFSATMTSSVDQLIRVGLNQPVRLMMDAKRQTVVTLTQEFVRLRPGREDKRLAYLMHLCETAYKDRCIVFFRQKKEVHRVSIVFGQCGFKVAELHGNMSQEQRINAVESFRAQKVTHLLATDVASRGLDVQGVRTVINYEAPQSLEVYLHRVGRTARAGRVGHSCTLTAESDRKVVKQAVKTAKSQGAEIVSRVVDKKIIDDWGKRLEGMETVIEANLDDEKEALKILSAEMQVKKGENMLDHEREIMSRPKRTWFEGEKDRQTAKTKGLIELNGVDSVKKRFKGKLSNKQKKKLDMTKEGKEMRSWKKGKEQRGMKVGKHVGKPKGPFCPSTAKA